MTLFSELSMGRFCGPIQPNPSADWPSPTQLTTSGKRWTQLDPTKVTVNIRFETGSGFKMSLSNLSQQEITDPTQPIENWKILTQPNPWVNPTHGQLWFTKSV